MARDDIVEIIQKGQGLLIFYFIGWLLIVRILVNYVKNGIYVIYFFFFIYLESEADPAQVFISYQWDTQGEVNSLRDKLEKTGFSCWMDIGQMGGGDQLYAKIDEAIRNCKVSNWDKLLIYTQPVF